MSPQLNEAYRKSCNVKLSQFIHAMRTCDCAECKIVLPQERDVVIAQSFIDVFAAHIFVTTVHSEAATEVMLGARKEAHRLVDYYFTNFGREDNDDGKSNVGETSGS